jgi:hypothetical protein
MHDHRLSDPRFKCILHVTSELLFASERAALVTASPRDTVKSYSRLSGGNRPVVQSASEPEYPSLSVRVVLATKHERHSREHEPSLH